MKNSGFIKCWYRCVRFPACDFAWDADRAVFRRNHPLDHPDVVGPTRMARMLRKTARTRIVRRTRTTARPKPTSSVA